MFAAVALTPINVFPGGREETVYTVVPRTPWFVTYDSAVLAQMNLPELEPGTYPYILAQEQIIDGTVTLPVDGRFPTAPPLPTPPYTPPVAP